MKQQGFTLLELLVVMSVGVVIAGIILALTTTGLKSVRLATQEQKLHSDGLYVTDILALWLKQATGFKVENSGQALTIYLPDGSTEKFDVQNVTRKGITNSAITINGAPITSSGINVCSTTFLDFSYSVRLTSTFNTAACGATTGQSFNFTTTVAQRYVP